MWELEVKIFRRGKRGGRGRAEAVFWVFVVSRGMVWVLEIKMFHRGRCGCGDLQPWGLVWREGERGLDGW